MSYPKSHYNLDRKLSQFEIIDSLANQILDYDGSKLSHSNVYDIADEVYTTMEESIYVKDMMDFNLLLEYLNSKI